MTQLDASARAALEAMRPIRGLVGQKKDRFLNILPATGSGSLAEFYKQLRRNTSPEQFHRSTAAALRPALAKVTERLSRHMPKRKGQYPKGKTRMPGTLKDSIRFVLIPPPPGKEHWSPIGRVQAIDGGYVFNFIQGTKLRFTKTYRKKPLDFDRLRHKKGRVITRGKRKGQYVVPKKVRGAPKGRVPKMFDLVKFQMRFGTMAADEVIKGFHYLIQSDKLFLRPKTIPRVPMMQHLKR